MTASQLITLLVLAAVVATLIWDKLRADVVALAGAAILLMTGVVRPVEVQSAFASPAIVALASLFVIAYAMELAGLLDEAIRRMVMLCKRIGSAGLWVVIGLAGAASAFLNNTPSPDFRHLLFRNKCPGRPAQDGARHRIIVEESLLVHAERSVRLGRFHRIAQQRVAVKWAGANVGALDMDNVSCGNHCVRRHELIVCRQLA